MNNKRDWAAVAVALTTATSTVALSMVLNSWAFTALLDSWFGHVLGVLLPLWVLALTFMGHRFWKTQQAFAVGCYSLAGFALLVSMPHLAAGYGKLGLHWWETWSLALVTDLTQVLCKLLVITLYDQEVKGQFPQQTKVVKRKRKTLPKLAA